MTAGLNGVNPSIMRTEVRFVDPTRPKIKKIGAGAKFASALGSFLGPVASIAGIFFPPAFAIGAAAYGMKGLAQQSIMRQQAANAQQQASYQAQQGQQTISFMGYEGGQAPIRPAAGGGLMGHRPPQADPMMDILFMRQEATQQMINTDYRR